MCSAVPVCDRSPVLESDRDQAAQKRGRSSSVLGHQYAKAGKAKRQHLAGDGHRWLSERTGQDLSEDPEGEDWTYTIPGDHRLGRLGRLDGTVLCGVLEIFRHSAPTPIAGGIAKTASTIVSTIKTPVSRAIFGEYRSLFSLKASMISRRAFCERRESSVSTTPTFFCATVPAGSPPVEPRLGGQLRPTALARLSLEYRLPRPKEVLL